MRSTLPDSIARRSFLGGSDARIIMGRDEAALVRLWRDVPDPRHWQRYLLLGLVLGLGVLTKLSLLGLVGLALLALALLAWRRRDWRLLAFGGGSMLIAVLIVSGWWFARNLSLYGDLTALDPFIAVQGTRDAPITWRGWSPSATTARA